MGSAPHFHIGSAEVVAVEGDITEQKVDAIVNSANTHMQLAGESSVAGAIIRRTHGKVEEALARIQTPVALGGVVVTDGCGLPCRFILHVATHGLPAEEAALGDDDLAIRLEAISRGVRNSVLRATGLGVTYLAMPFLRQTSDPADR